MDALPYFEKVAVFYKTIRCHNQETKKFATYRSEIQHVIEFSETEFFFFFYIAVYICPFYWVTEHGKCHRMFRLMQALCVIKQTCSGPRSKGHRSKYIRYSIEIGNGQLVCCLVCLVTWVGVALR
jgi:hypothetical protein